MKEKEKKKNGTEVTRIFSGFFSTVKGGSHLLADVRPKCGD